MNAPLEQVYLKKLVVTKDLEIKYRYKNKIYDRTQFQIGEVEELFKEIKIKENKEPVSQILNEIFPKEIKNIIYKYYDIGKKRYSKKDLKNHKRLQEFLKNVLYYLDKINYGVKYSGTFYKWESGDENPKTENFYINGRSNAEGKTLVVLLKFIINHGYPAFNFSNLVYADKDGKISIQDFVEWNEESNNNIWRRSYRGNISLMLMGKEGGITINNFKKYLEKHNV